MQMSDYGHTLFEHYIEYSSSYPTEVETRLKLFVSISILIDFIIEF